MSIGARVFVGIVFTVLGLSFIATTLALYYEFGYTNAQTDWVGIATFYSHLFIFFPVFGLLALAAFYLPCCVFTDMYWKHVPMGRFRFGLGFVVLLAFSVFGGIALGKGQVRSIWEVKPEVLANDVGECTAEKQCTRAPVLEALRDVRYYSQKRTGMGLFARSCVPDELIDTPPAEWEQLRHCFATRNKVDASTCCAAQRKFSGAMADMYKPEANRSLTSVVHRATLPLKIFFLLVVLVVGVLLAVRRRGIAEHYAEFIPQIERGVVVGAFTMLFLPIMNLAFLQSNALLYGTEFESLYREIAIPATLLFGAWALLLLFFFFRDVDKEWETVGRIAGVVGSMLAIANYETVIDYFVRFAGSGADRWTLGLLGFLALLALIAIIVQPRGKPLSQK